MSEDEKSKSNDDESQQQQQEHLRSTDADVARLRRHARNLRDALLRLQRQLLSQRDEGSENGHGGNGSSR